MEILGNVFECKLVPKGNGIYYIPVVKEVYKNMDVSEKLDVRFKIIEGLSRINSNSPYNKENPIRIIDSINYLRQPRSGLCGQTCIAMLAGISVDEAIKVMKSSRWQASMGKIMETLDYFGLLYDKQVYTRGKEVKLPKCCIVNVKGDPKSHLMVYYNGKYYDPTCGVLQKYQFKNIICYIGINVGND